MDLNSLTLEELKTLQKDVARHIATFEQRQKAEARRRLEDLAKSFGFSLSEFVDGTGKQRRAPAGIKFRHPEDSTLSWSGRGRKPAWFVTALESGLSEDSLRAS